MPRDCNSFRIQIILKFESVVLILAKKAQNLGKNWEFLKRDTSQESIKIKKRK